MPCIYFISSIINSIIPQSLYHFHLDSYSISCSPIRIKHIADFIYPSIPQVSSILIGDFIFSLFVYIDNAKLILKGYVASSSEMAMRRANSPLASWRARQSRGRRYEPRGERVSVVGRSCTSEVDLWP